MKNCYKYFSNKECKYYPCHDTKGRDINCLFCFCPLYSSDCGGNFKILPNGIKDCSDCVLVHTDGGYDYVIEKLSGGIKDKK